MPMSVPKAYLRVPGAQPIVDPTWLAVAAGDLHTEGKLFMPAEVVPGDVAASNPEGKALPS